MDEHGRAAKPVSPEAGRAGNRTISLSLGCVKRIMTPGTEFPRRHAVQALAAWPVTLSADRREGVPDKLDTRGLEFCQVAVLRSGLKIIAGALDTLKLGLGTGIPVILSCARVVTTQSARFLAPFDFKATGFAQAHVRFRYF